MKFYRFSPVIINEYIYIHLRVKYHWQKHVEISYFNFKQNCIG